MPCSAARLRSLTVASRDKTGHTVSSTSTGVLHACLRLGSWRASHDCQNWINVFLCSVLGTDTSQHAGRSAQPQKHKQQSDPIERPCMTLSYRGSRLHLNAPHSTATGGQLFRSGLADQNRSAAKQGTPAGCSHLRVAAAPAQPWQAPAGAWPPETQGATQTSGPSPPG